MTPQLPNYRTENRDAAAPQPGPPQGQQPPAPDQTQANNGGPKGMGQPASSNRNSAQPPMRPQQQGAPMPPPPGSGKPGALYPPPPFNLSAEIWSSRNSMPPVDLIQAAFLQAFQRHATADEMSTFLQTPGADQLAQQLISMTNPGQQSPVQQAIMAPSQKPF